MDVNNARPYLVRGPIYESHSPRHLIKRYERTFDRSFIANQFSSYYHVASTDPVF